MKWSFEWSIISSFNLYVKLKFEIWHIFYKSMIWKILYNDKLISEMKFWIPNTYYLHLLRNSKKFEMLHVFFFTRRGRNMANFHLSSCGFLCLENKRWFVGITILRRARSKKLTAREKLVVMQYLTNSADFW